MNITVRQYRSYPALDFPLHLESGMTVTELDSQCNECGSRLEDLRGEVREYGNCSDVKFAGLCRPCNLLVTCRFRHYRDGRIEEERAGNWLRLGKVGWRSKLRGLLEKLGLKTNG